MKNEIGFNPEKELKLTHEIKEISNEQGVIEYFEFADKILGVDWGDEDVPEEYTPKYIAKHPEITRIFEIKDENDEIIAGAKVKKIDDQTKLRLGLNRENYANKEGALLEYTAVKEEFRNKGLLSDLTEKRIQWAKNNGAEYVCAEAEITNPVSTYTKLRDGFTIIGICEPGEGVPDPYFVMVKQITEKEDFTKHGNSKDSSTPQWEEIAINIDSYESLKQYFEKGWVGVDIKGAQESPGNLEIPWILVMEKE